MLDYHNLKKILREAEACFNDTMRKRNKQAFKNAKRIFAKLLSELHVNGAPLGLEKSYKHLLDGVACIDAGFRTLSKGNTVVASELFARAESSFAKLAQEGGFSNDC